MKSLRIISQIALALFSHPLFADTEQRLIKLNQLGYTPTASKVAIVPASTANNFLVLDADTKQTVFEGTLSKPKYWEYSDEMVQQADFSELKQQGAYIVVVNSIGESHTFEISDAPLYEVHKASVKAFYFNRAGMAVTREAGGLHARAAGHFDTSVKVHKSAATKSRPMNTVLSLSKGWYDAGDYGKYVVNSGISTYTLLMSYMHYSDFYRNLNLDIAESGDSVPDLIDEIKWNLDWFEEMQDVDGGVYHKLTPLQFSEMGVAPDKDKSQRYVIGKSVTASLNFAAVMSVASRVMMNFEEEFPGASSRYRAKALKAYEWAKKNPKALYRQPRNVGTGAYGDKSASDEFAWAAAELFLLTGEQSYFESFRSYQTDAIGNLSWSSVAPLAFISLTTSSSSLLNDQQYASIRKKLLIAADAHYSVYQNSAYGVSVSKPDFVWGSNGDVLNNGLILMQAYRLSNDEKYMHAAMSTLDYVLGKNATGYSFVTGYGDKTPKNIHHRPSVADKTDVPVPGFLAGGPHTGKQDRCQYSGRHPATTYADTVCSYSTNEIAINWNAPLVYMLAAALNID